MNWGTKIVIVYVFFVAGILFMVFRSSTQKTDLVTTDYYAKELKYQQKIDEMNRVAALSASPEIQIEGRQAVIFFPKEFTGKLVKGEAVLYCPSDERKDIKNHFSVQDQPLRFIIPSTNKGLHELHLSWETDGITYYFEKKIFV